MGKVYTKFVNHPPVGTYTLTNAFKISIIKYILSIDLHIFHVSLQGYKYLVREDLYTLTDTFFQIRRDSVYDKTEYFTLSWNTIINFCIIFCSELKISLDSINRRILKRFTQIITLEN